MINTGNTNIITTGPDLADIDMTSYYTTLQSSTNYKEAILNNGETTYVSQSETEAALTFRDAFRQGDSVTAVNKFYNNLQKKYFFDASFSFDTVAYWFRKLKYSSYELISLNNQGSVFGSKILPQLKPAVSQTMKSSYDRGYSLQQSSYNAGNNSTQQNKLLATTKSKTGQLATLADTAVTAQSFFNNMSDSIGTLANSKFMQLDSTLPVFDVSQEYYGVPIPYSASTDSKISNNTRNIAYYLSLKTTALMRRNLLNVAYGIPADARNMSTDATLAHGGNLINDLPTFTAINASLPLLLTSIATTFIKTPRLFDFIRYLSNIGNQMAVNLRDIFPVTAADRDFTVVTTSQRALASNAERKQIANDAITQSYIEQQAINYSNQYGNPTTQALPNQSGQTPGLGAAFASGTNPVAGTSTNPLNNSIDNLAIKTYTGSDGKTYMDYNSYMEVATQRLQNSPLLSTSISDAKTYGITTPSDPKQWAQFLWNTAQIEQGGQTYQYTTGPKDPGGSFGAWSVSPDNARAYGGYSGVTPNMLQNPNLNFNVIASATERLVTRTGSIAGLYAGNGGIFAGRTMRKLAGAG